MIPGGRAGIAALHTLRVSPKGLSTSPDTEQRDKMLEEHIRSNPRAGQPNQAVAAAWEDSAYAEAVICGRENRHHSQCRPLPPQPFQIWPIRRLGRPHEFGLL